MSAMGRMQASRQALSAAAVGWAGEFGSDPLRMLAAPRPLRTFRRIGFVATKAQVFEGSVGSWS